MARPQQRYHSVSQRHWGTWVSEIRQPLLKTRIWLGTFETAENAAWDYDEAARLMCGPRARTKFPYNPNSSPNTKFLLAKLHRYNMISLQANQPINARDYVKRKSKNEEQREAQWSYLKEEDIEKMIEELLDSGISMELCSTTM